jgi:hypothetical protein
MASSYTSTRLFQGRDFGDSFEAYSAILQQLYTAAPNSKLVKRFSLKITERSTCRCSTESQDWSPDCFALSVYMNGGKGFLETVHEDFSGKSYQYCIGNRRCKTTNKQQEFREAPQSLVFQLNYDSLEAQSYRGRRDPSASRRTKFEEVFDLSSICELSGVYILKGAVLMVPGHFFSAFKSRSGWRIFNDSSVSDSSCSSFNDLMNYCYGRHSRPYMLFYSKEHSSDYGESSLDHHKSSWMTEPVPQEYTSKEAEPQPSDITKDQEEHLVSARAPQEGQQEPQTSTGSTVEGQKELLDSAKVPQFESQEDPELQSICIIRPVQTIELCINKQAQSSLFSFCELGTIYFY